MAFSFAGNAYLDLSYVTNSSIGNSSIKLSSIKQSSIDMLSSSGNFQNITNTATPINNNDVAIKSYVDNLGITILDYNLTGVQNTIISTVLSGSFIITITSLVLNGPSAIFNVCKNIPSRNVAYMKTVNCVSTDLTTSLSILWNPNEGIKIFKSTTNYDGSYQVKIM